MPRIDKATRRDAARDKARFNRTTSRAFLHTLDRLAAERDRRLAAKDRLPNA